MAKIEILLPAMGEGIIEASITRWLVSEGDHVEEDQPLLEVATDKVDSEIPSPVSGLVTKILIAAGETPQTGSILAIIETTADPGRTDPDEVEREVARIKETKDTSAPEAGFADDQDTATHSYPRSGGIPRQTPSGKFLTPLVRSIAKKENISLSELDNLPGSGEAGRITKNDLASYIASRDQKYEPGIAGPEVHVATKEAAPAPSAYPAPGRAVPGEEDKIVEMSRVRRIIAGHMLASKQISPHVTSFIDADVSELVRWRESNKTGFFERENQKITYTPLFIEAAAKALRDYPMVNVSVDGTRIIVRKNVNIGFAVALPDGNLIVPVIKNADEKSLVGLARAVNDLAERARSNKLQPSETSNGTFTITNFGTFRNTAGTPIINQPEAAILGVGAIIKKPVVVESPKGDVIAIRNIMTLSLSYDHRVVDGALGGMFLERIASYLENFDAQRKI